MASQLENAPNKPVHLMYLVGTVIMFYLLQWSIDWVWGFFSTSPSDFKISILAAVAATAIGVFTYKSDRIFHLANEVSSELSKVTWPTGKEVRMATFTVIVMAIVSAIILGLFDFVWSNLTEIVYGG